MTVDWLPSVCPHDCPSVCALEVERLDGARLGRVRGSDRNPFTAGVICAKVARYAERFHHPDRLGHPLRRVGPKSSGRFERIDWDDALDLIADELMKRARRHGSETVWPFFYAGTMGLVQRDGIHRLRHAMRYSRQHETFCVMLSDTGWRAGHGQRWGTPAEEIGPHSDLIVVWGANPVSTHVNLMAHVARARKERGAKLVVVDPYRNGTAAQADLHLAIRPSTDAALACAVMHVLFRDGHADLDYLARHADDWQALEAHVADRPPAWAARITGLPAEQIEAFAMLYGRTPRSYLRLGFGFTRSRNGAINMHAASCLPVVTGAWQHAGGGALYNQGDLYHWDKSTITGQELLDPSTRILDMSRIGPVLTGDRRDLGAGPPVTALFIQNTNPMAVAPDLTRVHAGFAREDLFVAVQEQFMTETAAAADVVLPATMFLEHDDIYQASCHTRIQIARKLFEPHAECRPNHWVICELAKRLGAPAHAGFELSEWELIDDLLQRSGWPDAETVWQAGGWDASPGFRTTHHLDGFPTPSGRFQCKPDWAALGPNHERCPALPDHVEVIDQVTPDRPFRLVAAPARNYLNTSFTETPTSAKREGRPTVQIHPDDARRLGIASGERVRLGNEQGEVRLHASIAEGQQPGVLVVESIWPNAAFEGGIGINALVSAEPGLPNGGAVFHDTAVWLAPAVARREHAPAAAEALA